MRSAQIWALAAGALAIGTVADGILATSARAQDAKPAKPGIDRFLKLPATEGYAPEEKSGVTRSEWRQRFADARAALAAAEKKLAESQKKLAAVAGSASEWRFTPPGVPTSGDADQSASFTLREEVRRNRNERDRAQRRLRELDVEANLAGVPEEWRGPVTDAPSGDGPDHDSGTGASARP